MNSDTGCTFNGIIITDGNLYPISSRGRHREASYGMSGWGLNVLEPTRHPGANSTGQCSTLMAEYLCLYPKDPDDPSASRHAGLYFKMESIDALTDKLRILDAHIIEIVERTEYGRREVVFKDLNGFQVTFSCDPAAR